MLPGVLLPSGCLYSLFRPEREAKERYISDLFTAGLIRPKSSPLGAGFFFVNKKDKYFLGFSNFNKQFILDNSEVAAPLTRLRSVNVMFCWSPEAHKVFIKLKKQFTSASILIQLDASKEFLMEVFASEAGVRAV